MRGSHLSIWTLLVPMVASVTWLLMSDVPSMSAAKFNKVVDIGQQAPEWKELIGTDDKQYQMSDWKDAKVLVVVFTCNHCPIARAYEKRLIEYTKEYKDKSVAIVAISVSKIEADQFEKMKEHAKEHGFNFPYLHDDSQDSARNWGATRTPQVFVLDQQRRFAYMGAVDDNMNPSQVTKHYLRNAVDAVLSGKQPEITESRQIGCAISYEPQ